MSKKKVIFIIVGVTAFVAGIVAGVAKRKKKSKVKEYDFPEMDLDDYFDDLDDPDDDYDDDFDDVFDEDIDKDIDFAGIYKDIEDIGDINDPELNDSTKLIRCGLDICDVANNIVKRKRKEYHV